MAHTNKNIDKIRALNKSKPLKIKVKTPCKHEYRYLERWLEYPNQEQLVEKGIFRNKTHYVFYCIHCLMRKDNTYD